MILDPNLENNFVLSRMLIQHKIKLLQQPLRQSNNRPYKKNKTMWNINTNEHHHKLFKTNKKYAKLILNTDHNNRKSQQQIQHKENRSKMHPHTILYNRIENKIEQQNMIDNQQNNYLKEENSLLKTWKKCSLEPKNGLMFSKKDFQQRTNAHNQIEAPFLNFLFKNYQNVKNTRKNKQNFKDYQIVRYQKKQLVPKELVQRKLISCSEKRQVNTHLLKAKLHQKTIRVRQYCKKSSKQLQQQNSIFLKNKSIDIGISPW